ncbi:hypothetical protein ZWY2020_051064 [Hordeum vulgare]|nr:hypothetical protein ZWY2020_051064 [Hordeum vulgare]
MLHNYGNTIPLHPSSAQPDMDEIESLMADLTRWSVSVAIASDGFGPPSNTLTEPVWDTVKRDLALIVSNLKLVVFPNPNREDPGKALRDWDLWGPSSSSASHCPGPPLLRRYLLPLPQPDLVVSREKVFQFHGSKD